jgi:hypothetical protein
MYIKTEQTPDRRRWADLNAAQLVAALGSARPATMAAVNAKAKAWAKARGFDGAVGWTIDDLVDAGLAVRTLGGRRRRARAGGFVKIGTFRWVDQKTGKVL